MAVECLHEDRNPSVCMCVSRRIVFPSFGSEFPVPASSLSLGLGINPESWKKVFVTSELFNSLISVPAMTDSLGDV